MSNFCSSHDNENDWENDIIQVIYKVTRHEATFRRHSYPYFTKDLSSLARLIRAKAIIVYFVKIALK